MGMSAMSKLAVVTTMILAAAGLMAVSEAKPPAASAAMTSVSSDPVVLGTILVDYHDRGLLSTDCTIDKDGVIPCAGGRDAIYSSEIVPLSKGNVPAPGAQCSIDVRVLQLLVLVIDHFQQRVNVTDLERRCVGSQLSLLNHGAQDGHGGWAIDIDSIGGSAVNGKESSTKGNQLLSFLSSIKPTQGKLHVGQSTCGRALSYGFADFFDDCTHQHIDFSTTAAGLNIPTSAPGGTALPGGTLVQVTGSNAGGWQTAPLPIQAGSGNISATYVGGGYPQIWENDKGYINETWGDGNGWHRQWIGVPPVAANSSIAAVGIPGDPNARVYVNDGGYIKEISGSGGWNIQSTPIQVSPNAQIAAVWESGNWGQLWVNDGGTIYEVWVNGGVWTKQSSGITVAADAKLSPVNVNGTIHIFIQSGGNLYVMWAGNGWQIQPVPVPTIGNVSISAVYMGGSEATIMVNKIAGTNQIGLIGVGANGWTLQYTGQGAGTGVITAVNAKPGVTSDNYPYVMVVR